MCPGVFKLSSNVNECKPPPRTPPVALRPRFRDIPYGPLILSQIHPWFLGWRGGAPGGLGEPQRLERRQAGGSSLRLEKKNSNRYRSRRARMPALLTFRVNADIYLAAK